MPKSVGKRSHENRFLHTINTGEIKLVSARGFDKISDGEDDDMPSSKCLRIRMIPVSDEELISDKLQLEDARIIFEWMQTNLPHGTYTKLLEMMAEHR